MNPTKDDDVKKSEREGPSRRTFVTQAACLALCGGSLGTILQGCGGVTSPSDVPALQTVSGTRVSGGPQNSFVALNAICTHQTCTITGFGNQNYVCPCHGSAFDVNGHVLGGPAPAPLHQYPTQFANRVLTITA
jgi:Rieske Fe-S protein